MVASGGWKGTEQSGWGDSRQGDLAWCGKEQEGGRTEKAQRMVRGHSPWLQQPGDLSVPGKGVLQAFVPGNSIIL